MFNCELCNIELKKNYFENVRTICGKCHYKQECAEDIKHELLEQKAKALIPANYNFDIHDLRYNKFCYRQALIRYHCSIPDRLIKISHWQLSMEINKIRLELKQSSKDKLYNDLINIIIGYTDQQFEYNVKMKHESSYPIHYLTD